MLFRQLTGSFTPIPYRLDRNAHGGGILIYIRNDIPSKLLKNHNIDGKIEGMFVKLNFRNRKWLLFGGYNPHKDLSSQFESLDFYLPHYENTLILGDFNVEEDEGDMSEFCENYNFTNLVKEPTCFKNMNNTSCIDLIITNRKRYFQHTKVIETGISDHHKMTITMFKSKFQKAKPNIITYRDYKNFDRDLFRKQLSERFSVHDEIQYKCFDEIYINILDRHAPIKTKYVRANDGSFMNKTLKKAIMKRANLRKKYLKSTTEKSKNAYRKQRNFCVKLFKKEKRNITIILVLNKLQTTKSFGPQ